MTLRLKFGRNFETFVQILRQNLGQDIEILSFIKTLKLKFGRDSEAECYLQAVTKVKETKPNLLYQRVEPKRGREAQPS